MYDQFIRGKNAIIPRPTWPATDCTTNVSTTPPHNETTTGAVDFELWKQIGGTFMVTSNINSGLVCEPGIGNLVKWIEGSISCTVIETVKECNGVPTIPSFIEFVITGALLNNDDLPNTQYYQWDCSNNRHWPTHDPCGRNEENHKTRVENPLGRIYLL